MGGRGESHTDPECCQRRIGTTGHVYVVSRECQARYHVRASRRRESLTWASDGRGWLLIGHDGAADKRHDDDDERETERAHPDERAEPELERV